MRIEPRVEKTEHRLERKYKYRKCMYVCRLLTKVCKQNCNLCSLGVCAHTVTHLQRTVDTVQVYNTNTLVFTKYPEYRKHNDFPYLNLIMQLLELQESGYIKVLSACFVMNAVYFLILNRRERVRDGSEQVQVPVQEPHRNLCLHLPRGIQKGRQQTTPY